MATAEATLLRIATAGSVDDGKSTLIGRLLYDAKAILSDQLDAVQQASERRSGAGGLDLSLLTDGLRAEREQGITIDVAHRYFQTPRRAFILADTPGHVQYTRNMVTGASRADLAIVLLDARHGVVEQTRRHTSIAALLGIRHLAFAVNKMDLVDFDEARFDRIAREVGELTGAVGVQDVALFPISARDGDNVVDRSARTPWYEGPTLLEHLEGVRVADDLDLERLRFPVQWVIRDHAADYRGYAGRLAGGTLRAGDEVVVLPAGVRARVEAVETADGPLEEAVVGESVAVRLADDVDVSRGDVLVGVDAQPSVDRELELDLCWMADAPLRAGARVLVKHTTATVAARVDALLDRLDVTSLRRSPAPDGLELNDVGRVRLRTQRPLVWDPYDANRTTGSCILIDEATNDTVGAGMLRAAGASG